MQEKYRKPYIDVITIYHLRRSVKVNNSTGGIKKLSKLIEGKIECPFYLKEGNSFIKCEGGICGTECVHRFGDNDKKLKYETEVCSKNGGRKCVYHRMVAEIYERKLSV